MENTPTRISISHAGTKLTAELSWDASIYDIMDALNGMLIGLGYDKDALIDWAQEVSEEQE